MDADEKQQLHRIIGVGIAIMVLIVAAILILDVRSLVQANKPQVEAAVNQAVSEAVHEALPYTRPRVDDQGNFIEYEEDNQLPRGVAMRGRVARGQTVSGTVGMYHMEGWSLEGRAGDQFLLDFEPLEGGYTWQITVYEPDYDMLAFTADSEAGYADFSQLVVRLPADGIYFVVISAFGEDGEYELIVQ